MMKQNSLLEREQGIDILDVLCSARHGLYDLVELLGAQLSECEHLRGDVITPLRDEIRAQLGLLLNLAAQHSSKLVEVWVIEYISDVHGKAQLAQPFHHLHDQQRVAAQ